MWLLWLDVSLIVCNAVYDKEFEDTNGVIRIRKSKKDKQRNGQKKKDKRSKNKKTHLIYKTLHRKLKSE